MGTLDTKEYIRIRTEKHLKLKTLGIEISNSIEHTMFENVSGQDFPADIAQKSKI